MKVKPRSVCSLSFRNWRLPGAPENSLSTFNRHCVLWLSPPDCVLVPCLPVLSQASAPLQVFILSLDLLSPVLGLPLFQCGLVPVTAVYPLPHQPVALSHRTAARTPVLSLFVDDLGLYQGPGRSRQRYDPPVRDGIKGVTWPALPSFSSLDYLLFSWSREWMILHCCIHLLGLL